MFQTLRQIFALLRKRKLGILFPIVLLLLLLFFILGILATSPLAPYIYPLL